MHQQRRGRIELECKRNCYLPILLPYGSQWACSYLLQLFGCWSGPKEACWGWVEHRILAALLPPISTLLSLYTPQSSDSQPFPLLLFYFPFPIMAYNLCKLMFSSGGCMLLLLMSMVASHSHRHPHCACHCFVCSTNGNNLQLIVSFIRESCPLDWVVRHVWDYSVLPVFKNCTYLCWFLGFLHSRKQRHSNVNVSSCAHVTWGNRHHSVPVQHGSRFSGHYLRRLMLKCRFWLG